MGTLIVLGAIVLGGMLGIIIFSLLSMAKKGEQIYEVMLRGEEIVTPVNPLNRPTSETPSPTGSGEARPQRNLRALVVAP